MLPPPPPRILSYAVSVACRLSFVAFQWPLLSSVRPSPMFKPCCRRCPFPLNGTCGLQTASTVCHYSLAASVFSPLPLLPLYAVAVVRCLLMALPIINPPPLHITLCCPLFVTSTIATTNPPPTMSLYATTITCYLQAIHGLAVSSLPPPLVVIVVLAFISSSAFIIHRIKDFDFLVDHFSICDTLPTITAYSLRSQSTIAHREVPRCYCSMQLEPIPHFAPSMFEGFGPLPLK